jgi:hypothetical protein
MEKLGDNRKLVLFITTEAGKGIRSVCWALATIDSIKIEINKHKYFMSKID